MKNGKSLLFFSLLSFSENRKSMEKIVSTLEEEKRMDRSRTTRKETEEERFAIFLLLS